MVLAGMRLGRIDLDVGRRDERESAALSKGLAWRQIVKANMVGSIVAVLALAVQLHAQEAASRSSTSTVTAPSESRGSAAASVSDGTWRASETTGARSTASISSQAPSLDAHKVRPAKAAVPLRFQGEDTLPNDGGQVWQRYDVSAYTSQVEGVEKPQQAIIDWILRETGTDVWFASPLGLLSADEKTLSVYHTPQMQRIVADVVGQFVNGTQDPHVLNVRLISVNSPNWRTGYIHRLRHVEVQSPGIEAWLVSKEDAALLLADLRRRSDFREHNTSNLVYHNGQSQTITQRRPRNYVRSYRSRKQGTLWTGYDIDWAQFQEGFTLQISPLLSQDERTLDAAIKCEIDQVEKLVPVGIDLSGFNNQLQRVEVQVPQIVSWRLHERFRWPTNQVLVLSCGVVASPGPDRALPLGFLNPFTGDTGRADALMFLESRGKASQALSPPQTAAGNGLTINNPAARY